MVERISTLGLQLISAKNLSSGQSMLSTLSQQLTTGKYSTNMVDYRSSDAQKLLNLTSQTSTQEGFLTVIENLMPRMTAYDQSLTGIENTVGDAYSTLLASTAYDETKNSSIQSAIRGYIEDMVYYLDQKVGERYIFAGTRYDTSPVVSADDILDPANIPPAGTTTVASPAVPNYDVNYDPLNPAAAVPEAWVKDSATIDTTKSLTYGITSTDKGFQQIILGLQWAYAATEDPANYQTYMDNALDLLSEGLSNVRAVHTAATNAYSTLEKTSKMIESKISSIENQVDNIEAVDVNEVSVKITVLQAQLESAYAVTAQIIDLSLLKYL